MINLVQTDTLEQQVYALVLTSFKLDRCWLQSETIVWAERVVDLYFKLCLVSIRTQKVVSDWRMMTKT